MNAALDEAPASQRWLDRFPKDQDVALISENRPYLHPEGGYDDQYGIQVADESGRGIANLLKKFDSDLSGPVLELGCGTGKATVGLCKSGAFPWYLITDSSKTFIDITRRKLQRNSIALDNIRFAVLSDTDLDRLPPASLSAIVLRSVLHHFTDVPRWIEAAARTLRPGGTLIFEEPCSPGYLLMGLVAKVAATASGQRPQARAAQAGGAPRRDHEVLSSPGRRQIELGGQAHLPARRDDRLGPELGACHAFPAEQHLRELCLLDRPRHRAHGFREVRPGLPPLLHGLRRGKRGQHRQGWEAVSRIRHRGLPRHKRAVPPWTPSCCRKPRGRAA